MWHGSLFDKRRYELRKASDVQRTSSCSREFSAHDLDDIRHLLEDEKRKKLAREKEAADMMALALEDGVTSADGWSDQDDGGWSDQGGVRVVSVSGFVSCSCSV